jgi:hypothetical protein
MTDLHFSPSLQSKRSISISSDDDDDDDDATEPLARSVVTTNEPEIVVRSRAFEERICRFPTRNNRIETLLRAGAVSASDVERDAQSVRIGVHWRVRELMLRFLHHFAVAGDVSEAARALYAALGDDVAAFAFRLVAKRPVAFLTSLDSALLRDGSRPGDRHAFTRIGTPGERAPLLVADYLAYPEIAVAALLTVSAYTRFINQGDRSNCARRGAPGSFVDSGVYIAAVGARFERDDQMETLFCVVNRDRSTADNGYGRAGSPQGAYHGLLRVFAPLYGFEHFPSWAEAAAEYAQRSSDADCRYCPLYGAELFDKLAYRARIRVTLEALLFDADLRGADAARPAYLYVTGLGLGVWAIAKLEQSRLFLDELARAIAAHALPHIDDVYVAWFPPEAQRCGTAADGDSLADAAGHRITIRFGNASPAALLPNPRSLLVATFAWDGNSFVGNEYFEGALAASADPAAAACSTVAEVANPYINPFFDASKTTILGQHEA